MSLRLEVRAALRADGRVIAPAVWRVEGGRTRSLDPLPRPGPALVDALLLPGLVNAHAHLDLGGVAALPASEPFTDWLLGVGGVRAAGRDVEEEARRQSQALARRGVTAVGDIDGSGGRATLGRRQGGLGGLSYLEIVGVQRESARARLAQSLALIDRLGGGSRALGLSPHAPYSVNTDVLTEIARAARLRGLRLAMHLAETADETRYLLRGDGPFTDFLRTIGRGQPFARAPGLRPVALAEQTGLLAAGCVVIHGNDLDDEDIARLATHRASVVYCHGTHAHFARPRHRLGDLMAAGVNVALGTDSGLSNRGVDLFDELCRLHADRPELDPLALLRCATWGGRVALQHEPAAALLQPGSPADALLLAAPANAEQCSAQELAAWALSGASAPWLTIHAGAPSGAREPLPAPLRAFLDTTMGHG
jgi:aminodeoxyfutalosine deaminase